MSAPLPRPPESVRRRYDALARWYPIFEWLLWLPRGFRRRAVGALELRPGDSVLEVGCGTGRNLPLIRSAVGPSGRVVGVDLSVEMLTRARRLCERSGWDNVTLLHGHVLECELPRPVDGVLFSLSYGTMTNRERILDRVWSLLAPGGRLVIADGKLAPGLRGRLLRPIVIAVMKATVLGDPDHGAWRDLRRLTADVEAEEELLGGYVICRARKGLP